MPSFPIRIEIDLPQPAVHHKEKGWAFSTGFDGPDQDYTLAHIWRDPGRQMACLQPWQLTPEWKTNHTGLLRRMGRLDYWNDSSTVSDNWEESAAFGIDGDTFLVAKTTNERLTTIRQFLPNTALFLRTFAYGGYGARETLFELDWGVPSIASDAPQYRMVLRFDGSFTLRKRDPDSGDLADVWESWLTPETRDAQDLHQKYFEVMIFPYRRNEILFWSSLGAYPSWLDPSIDPLKPNGRTYRSGTGGPRPGYGDVDDRDFIITEWGHAAIRYPNSKGYFQLSPVIYQCDASGIGTMAPTIPVKLPYAPDNALWPDGTDREVEIEYDLPYSSIVALSPHLADDGVDDEMDWELSLTGRRRRGDDGTTLIYPIDQAEATPHVYSFTVVIPPGTQTSADTPARIESYIRKLTRSYTEDGSACQIEFKDARQIGADTPSDVYMRALHRMCRIFWVDGAANENELFYGIATEPDYDQWSMSGDGLDHTPVGFTVHDPWHVFENTQLIHLRALDGLTLTAAIRNILDVVGWPQDRRDIDNFDAIVLPKNGKDPEKLLMSEDVANARDLLCHLRDEYTSADHWPYRARMDFAPVLKTSGPDAGKYKINFRFKNPDSDPVLLSGGQERTFYGTQASAVSAGKTLTDWLRAFRRKKLEPGANYVACSGYDPSGKPIVRELEDRPAQLPDTAFLLRTDTWIGRRREFGHVNTAWITPEFVQAATVAFFNRLSPARYPSEWTAEHATDDRIGEVVKLVHGGEIQHNADGDPVPLDRRYILTELVVEHILENADLPTIRTARYLGEALSPPPPPPPPPPLPL